MYLYLDLAIQIHSGSSKIVRFYKTITRSALWFIMALLNWLAHKIFLDKASVLIPIFCALCSHSVIDTADRSARATNESFSSNFVPESITKILVSCFWATAASVTPSMCSRCLSVLIRMPSFIMFSIFVYDFMVRKYAFLPACKKILG